MKSSSNVDNKKGLYNKLFRKINFYTRMAFLYYHESFRSFINLRFADKKHKLILDYLENNFKYVISKYEKVLEKDIKDQQERYIWTLWWQGEDKMPQIVKACHKQLKQNLNGAKLILITKNNYKDYIELPDYILEKQEKGYISFAQLSDIIRFSLLEKYGGLWLDSTIYTSKPIPESYFEYPFFSQHTKWTKTCFVQHNLWHGFIMGSQKGGKLVSFAKEMFFEYWKTHDVLIDYFMIDYIIMLAYNVFTDIKNEIDSLPYSSERLYDLVNVLSKEYNEDYFNSLKDDCIFSKFDWHKTYKTNVKGKETFYSHIVNL